MNEIIECPRGWGLSPADGARYHWSARAILKDGRVDLLWDRTGVEGNYSADERTALCAWLDYQALPYLRELALTDNDFPGSDERREVTVRGDGFTLRANPHASHGYLYMSATADPTSTEPTPKVTKRTKGRRR